MLAEYVCQNCEGVLFTDKGINTAKRRCSFCGKKKLTEKIGGKPDEYTQTIETNSNNDS